MNQQTPTRTFDFRRPDKFSKEQLRTLAVLHEHVARRWTSHWLAVFRLPSQVTVNRVEQATYDEFVRREGEAGVLGVLALPPLRGEAILAMDGRLALSFIDRLFGGPGQGTTPARTLTDVERAALAHVLQDLVDVLAEGWSGLLEVQPRVLRVEDNPLFVQTLAGSEAAAVVSFHATLGTEEGWVALFLPYFMLEPLLPRLNTQAWAGRYRHAGEEPEEHVHERLLQAPVTLSVVLGKVKLPLRKVLALEPGEILHLDTGVDDLLPLVVEGKPLFMGRAGRYGQRLAFRIEGQPQREEPEDDGQDESYSDPVGG